MGNGRKVREPVREVVRQDQRRGSRQAGAPGRAVTGEEQEERVG